MEGLCWRAGTTTVHAAHGTQEEADVHTTHAKECEIAVECDFDKCDMPSGLLRKECHKVDIATGRGKE